MLAWVYSRRSRALGDPDDPALMAAHLSALKRLAEQDGVTVPPANIRTEIGSGESMSGRPVFAALLAEWEALPPGSGGSLYCVEVQRLSRADQEESGRIQRVLARAGIQVRTPGRTYNLADPDDRLLYSVVAALSHHELGLNKQRIALKRAEMTRAGEVTTGTSCYGFRWIKSPGQVGGRPIPGHLEPEPAEFRLLVSICREVLTVSIQRLARDYGIPYGILQDTLHNPVICGFPARRFGLHHGTKPWKESHYLMPPEQWLWPEVPGQYLAACTRAEWDTIQAVLKERHTLRLKTGPALNNGWCRPIVTFTGCPGPAKLSSVPHGVGLVPTYARPRDGKPLLYVEREPVHAATVAALAALCGHPDALLAAVLALEAEREARAGAARSSGDLDQVRRQLTRERERLATLVGQGADPDLDEEGQLATRQAERECRRRLDQLKASLASLSRLAAPLPDLTGLLPALANLGDNFPGAWAAMPGVERQEIVVALVKEVPVTVIEGKRGVRWQREISPPVLPDWLEKV